MAGTVSGTLTLSTTLQVAMPATASGTAYNIPIALPSTNSPASVTYAAGTGANLANKVAYASGSAAASAASIDLSSLACTDGTTGFAHVREIIVFNLDGTNTLGWDFTVSNANVAMFGAGGATAKVTVQPGSFQAFRKPLGTNGYVVDGTHKIISLDPGANTVNYVVIVVGD